MKTDTSVPANNSQWINPRKRKSCDFAEGQVSRLQQKNFCCNLQSSAATPACPGNSNSRGLFRIAGLPCVLFPNRLVSMRNGHGGKRQEFTLPLNFLDPANKPHDKSDDQNCSKNAAADVHENLL
jgi:hypothetical protein